MGARFAVVGDIHGEYAQLVAALDEARRCHGPVDFILSVGDAEANRNAQDAAGVHAPAKYRKVGEFPDVIAGRLVLGAPLYFIGGNHEPWPALDATGAGEWAPGVHFLGRAGAEVIHDVRIAFLSGIYSPEISEGRGPRGKRDLKELTYWTRDDVSAALRAGRGRQVRPLDVLVTHDWPAGIGTNRAGAPAGQRDVRRLTDELRPQLHVCGHMHHSMEATIGPTRVLCLAHIRDGARAVAFVEKKDDGTLTVRHDD